MVVLRLRLRHHPVVYFAKICKEEHKMTRLMQSLGNPQSNYKAIHIAGIKGKGSTAAFLSKILPAQGYSVGCYTSPHIKTIKERIIVGRLGDPVSAKAVNSLFQRIKDVIDKVVKLEMGHLSHMISLFQKHFRGTDGELSTIGRLATCAYAGMTSTFVTYPLDVLRLRLAVDPGYKTMTDGKEVVGRKVSEQT